MSKTILAVGAHIGDMELTCGALLAANAVHGGRSVTLALTAGEKGAPAGADVAEYRKSKIAEAEAFAAELVGEAIVLGYSDGLLPDNDEARFAVCDVIRRVKPDILITHHAHSMHKDHAACHRIVTDAWFYAAIEGFERDLPRHFAICTMRKTGRMPRASGPMSISTCPTASHSGKRPSSTTGSPYTARAFSTRNTIPISSVCAVSRGGRGTASAL